MTDALPSMEKVWDAICTWDWAEDDDERSANQQVEREVRAWAAVVVEGCQCAYVSERQFKVTCLNPHPLNEDDRICPRCHTLRALLTT